MMTPLENLKVCHGDDSPCEPGASNYPPFHKLTATSGPRSRRVNIVTLVVEFSNWMDLFLADGIIRAMPRASGPGGAQ